MASVRGGAKGVIEAGSRVVLRYEGCGPTVSRDFQGRREELGRKCDLISNIRDGLVTMERLIGYLGHVTLQRKSEADIRARVKTLARDAASLNDYVSFLSQKITFLLDATLGMVNIEQRSEEHTSELQSLMRISYAVFCLKNKTAQYRITTMS